MSITTELREYASSLAMKAGASTTEVKGALEEIADRIDEKHEDELTMERGRAITELGSNIARNYIELPVDADGETIHLGDVMDNTHKDGFRAKRVTGICYHDGGKTTIEVDENRLRWHNVYKLHHVQPDSWERIISDALRADRTDAYAVSTSMLCELVERCKRLAGEDA